MEIQIQTLKYSYNLPIYITLLYEVMNIHMITLLTQYILTSFLTFTLSCAPWARSRVAISTDPVEAALCRGVSPPYYQV